MKLPSSAGKPVQASPKAKPKLSGVRKPSGERRIGAVPSTCKPLMFPSSPPFDI